MLLSRAESFVEMDESCMPLLVDEQVREISEKARSILASFARPIGDVDYVPMDQYKVNPSRLKKGGGGPLFDEIPPTGRKVLEQREGQIKVMCDPVAVYGTRRVARISVEDTEYFIARPDTILAYKVLHVLQSYEKKSKKFNSDFGKLFVAFKELYSEDELYNSTAQILEDYENEMERLHVRLNEDNEHATAYVPEIPQRIAKVLEHVDVSPEIRIMLERVVAVEVKKL